LSLLKDARENIVLGLPFELTSARSILGGSRKPPTTSLDFGFLIILDPPAISEGILVW
jgi:hypothetical protein